MIIDSHDHAPATTTDTVASDGAPGRDDAARYLALQRSATFTRLRSRTRGYLALMTGVFLGTFTATMLAAGWAPDTLTIAVAGHVNLGLLLAAVVMVLPIPMAMIHLRYASRRLDPLAGEVRAEFERNRR